MNAKQHLLSSLAIACISTAGTALAQDDASATRPLSDDRIADAVQDELLFDLAVPASKIDVSVATGVVTLEGTIDNLLAKERAARIAETVRGVRAIVNRLAVLPPIGRSDADIRADVRRALLDDPATDSYEVGVEASDGVVTLSGTVDSFREKQLCETVAKGVKGVLDTKNQISVNYKTERPDSEIAADVRKTLQWDEFVDNGLLDVSVDGGAVELTGTVGSAAEKRRATSLAWVAGVKSVDDAAVNVARWARDEDLRKSKYVHRSDAEVEKAVHDAMLLDPRVASFRVQADVLNGVVTLRGTVDNLAAKRAAAQDTRNTVGVWNVVNRLKVRPTGRSGDVAVANRVRDALERDPYVERHELTVHVRNGVASLYGHVDSDFEREQANDVVARTQGVVEVENHLAVQTGLGLRQYDPYVDPWMPHSRPYYGYWTGPYSYSALTDQQIEAEIEDELWWSPFVDGDEITVKVDDGVATLTGDVDSWSEFTSATENAYEGGAVRVRNRLQIGGGER